MSSPQAQRPDMRSGSVTPGLGVRMSASWHSGDRKPSKPSGGKTRTVNLSCLKSETLKLLQGADLSKYDIVNRTTSSGQWRTLLQPCRIFECFSGLEDQQFRICLEVVAFVAFSTFICFPYVHESQSQKGLASSGSIPAGDDLTLTHMAKRLNTAAAGNKQSETLSADGDHSSVPLYRSQSRGAEPAGGAAGGEDVRGATGKATVTSVPLTPRIETSKALEGTPQSTGELPLVRSEEPPCTAPRVSRQPSDAAGGDSLQPEKQPRELVEAEIIDGNTGKKMTMMLSPGQVEQLRAGTVEVKGPQKVACARSVTPSLVESDKTAESESVPASSFAGSVAATPECLSQTSRSVETSVQETVSSTVPRLDPHASELTGKPKKAKSSEEVEEPPALFPNSSRRVTQTIRDKVGNVIGMQLGMPPPPPPTTRRQFVPYRQTRLDGITPVAPPPPPSTSASTSTTDADTAETVASDEKDQEEENPLYCDGANDNREDEPRVKKRRMSRLSLTAQREARAQRRAALSCSKQVRVFETRQATQYVFLAP